MKTSILSFVIILFVFTGCSQDEAEIENNLTELSVTIKNTENYRYPITVGDEEGTSIKKQPDNYKVSEIRKEGSSYGDLVYLYEPSSDFTGVVYVEIVKQVNLTGKLGDDSEQLIRIKITVE